MNPIKKCVLLETRHEIQEALVSHFGNIGKDSTIDNEVIKTELDNITATMHQSTDMCSLYLTRSKIFNLIKNLKNGKSCGIRYTE